MKPTDVTGQWCIHYRKMTEPKVWHTMKLCRADGVLVSAKTFDEVFKFSRYREAFDFAKNMMNPPEQVNTRPGPPPAPVKTQNSVPPARPGSMNFTAHPGNRPDLAAATNPMFREAGVDLGDSRQNYQEAPKQIPTARPEMRGPQTTPDIDQLLSGLKPKKAETPVHVPPPVQQEYVQSAPTTQPTTPTVVEEMPMQGSESIISLSSLKDLDGTTMPKKSRRRNKSDRNNTVALDI